MRYRHLLFASSITGAAIMFACSYGNYDGVFPNTADGGDAGDGGAVVLAKAIDPANGEKLKTPDGALEIQFLAGTFDGPTTITVARVADRVLADNSLLVPAYAISATKEPLLPFQLAFTGNNPNPGQNVLVVARAGTDGQFAPVPLVGVAPMGPSGSTTTVWGLARNLGTFSLIQQPVSSAFFDVASNSCLAKCCNGQAPAASGNIGVVGSSCFCNGAPALECVQSCQPTIAAAIERCVENVSTGLPPAQCKPSSTNLPPCSGGACGYPQSGSCMNNQTCCIDHHAGQCLGQGNPGCTGIAIRCDLGTACADGTKCCVFDTEAYCASTCPNDRTWCNSPTDCAGGGACTPAPNCPHGTCGTPPVACTN